MSRLGQIGKKISRLLHEKGTALPPPLQKQKEQEEDLGTGVRELVRDTKKHNEYLLKIQKEFNVEHLCHSMKEVEQYFNITPMKELKKNVSIGNVSDLDRIEYERLKKSFAIIGTKKIEDATKQGVKKVLGIGIITPEIAQVAWEYEEIFLIGVQVINSIFVVDSSDFFGQGLDPDELLMNTLHYMETRKISDLHIKPYDNYSYVVEGRINKKLQKLREENITYEESESLFVAMKNMADRDHSRKEKETRALLRGILDNGVERNFRFHYLPYSNTGNNQAPSVSLRRLPNYDELLSMEQMGYDKESLELIRDFARHSENGIILFSGKMNSGKTTSLYALALDILDYEYKAISTIEAPIEVVIPELNQFDILATATAHENLRTTMSEAIKHQLSHDADIILASEVRFESEIKALAELARNGFLALSTIHANNNKDTIRKVLDAGVDAKEFKTQIRGCVNLALEPKKCQKCQGQGIVLNKKKEKLTCSACDGLGADGVVLIYDIISFMNIQEEDEILNFEELEKAGKAKWIKREKRIDYLIQNNLLDIKSIKKLKKTFDSEFVK